MALNVTPGDPAADSYATLVEAKTYNDTFRNFGDSWDQSDVSHQEAAMRQATIMIDSSFPWVGMSASSTQSLTWPRMGMLTRNGYPIDPTIIPPELKRAQSELARQLIEADRQADNDPLKQRIGSVRAGPVSVNWQEKNNSDLMAINADLQLQWPMFAWAERAMPDAVRLMMVPSWYERQRVGPQIMFGARR